MKNEKWNTQNRKGYLKIHIAVNIKTREILALEEVTDEKVHDSKMLKKRVDDVLKAVPSDEKNIVKKLKLVLLADGAHPSYRHKFWVS